MEPADPLKVFEHMLGVLLELAEEPSLDRLLLKLSTGAPRSPWGTLVVIWLIEDGDAGVRTLYAAAGGGAGPFEKDQPPRLPTALLRMPFGLGAIGGIAATGRPMELKHPDQDPEDLAEVADWLRTEHICRFLGSPIIYKDEVLGVLGAFCKVEPPERMAHWQRIIAAQIAGAIVNAKAFEEIRQLKDQLEQQNAYLREEVVDAKAWGDLVGESSALRQVVSQIELVAPTEASVLILGETGTGKELVAHEIHRQSRRKDRTMVRVNCASIPKDLYESEFFGHARGAFTGAIKDRAGRFETADGGTLFLDEIGEVPPEVQGKLLRVLQEKRYERVGEDRTRRADVRIVAATNRDLKKEVEAGRFRQDLYYRLNVFPIQIAPLRERMEDIRLLAQHFVNRSVKDLRCPEPRLTRAGLVQLQSYDWPGNVRELQNVIDRAVILARGGILEFNLPIPAVQAMAEPPSKLAQGEEPEYLTEMEMRQRERKNLLAILNKTGWKIGGNGGAAEILGVKPTTLVSRIKAMGLKQEE
jgi:transcriptional regulator with GAF, ATPase, and Fis domain